MKDFDLNDVRRFVSVAQAGTLTAAAKELHCPASTLSRALTRLEKHLGVLLVQRGPRGLVLTDAGPGSASATDKTYLTTNAYNTLGELTSQTGPPVPGFRVRPDRAARASAPMAAHRGARAASSRPASDPGRSGCGD